MPTPTEIISLVVACLSLVATVYMGLFKLAKIEARVELLWGFMMRKGMGEALISGLVERQSPLRVSIAALEKHGDLIEQVRKWYEQFGRKMPDIELTVSLETTFHADFERLCLTEGILPASCVAAMVFLLRPESKAFEPFRETDWAKSHSA